MGDCNDKSCDGGSKSSCCKESSCCDSGHNAAHAWMASRIAHLEKRSACNCRWIAIIVTALLCVASFFAGRCCGMSCGKGGPRGPMGGSCGPIGQCDLVMAPVGGDACGIFAGRPATFQWQAAPMAPTVGLFGPVDPGACAVAATSCAPCPTGDRRQVEVNVSKVITDALDGQGGASGHCEVRAKAIIVGPDGKQQEIDLSSPGLNQVMQGMTFKVLGADSEEDEDEDGERKEVDVIVVPAPPVPPKP